ncbi:hypothetical protein LOAG_15930, partial [Loa loa]
TTENLLPVHQTTGYDQSLTQEEMRHVTSVTSIAEKEINVQKAAFSKEFEFELTQDELEHIARVSCMAEEAFGKRQTIQRSEELIEEEGVKSDYEEYDVEEKESEKFSEHSQSKASSATSGPDSPQESVDVQMNPIQNILPSDAIDESVMVEKENEENVLNDDMEHLVDAISKNLLPVHQTTGYDQSLTQEEMRHVTSVTSIAEKEINVQKAAFSKEFEFELTQDELEHIARVSCMAEEAFGKRQTIQRSEELIEEEGVKSDYEEYDVEEKESEKFSEHSQSKASSATSGPDSPQES